MNSPVAFVMAGTWMSLGTVALMDGRWAAGLVTLALGFAVDLWGFHLYKKEVAT